MASAEEPPKKGAGALEREEAPKKAAGALEREEPPKKAAGAGSQEREELTSNLAALEVTGDPL